jgi:hypothetical protein
VVPVKDGPVIVDISATYTLMVQYGHLECKIYPLGTSTQRRLYNAGYIDDPKNKAKSVRTEERLEKSRELFERHFVRKAWSLFTQVS